MAFQITPLQISQRQTDYGQLGTLAGKIGEQFTSGLETGRKLQETAQKQQLRRRSSSLRHRNSRLRRRSRSCWGTSPPAIPITTGSAGALWRWARFPTGPR